MLYSVNNNPHAVTSRPEVPSKIADIPFTLPVYSERDIRSEHLGEEPILEWVDRAIEVFNWREDVSIKHILASFGEVASCEEISEAAAYFDDQFEQCSLKEGVVTIEYDRELLHIYLPFGAHQHFVAISDTHRWGTPVLSFQSSERPILKEFILLMKNNPTISVRVFIAQLEHILGKHQLSSVKTLKNEHLFPLSEKSEEYFLAKSIIINKIGLSSYKRHRFTYKILRFVYESNKYLEEKSDDLTRCLELKKEAQLLLMRRWKRQCEPGQQENLNNHLSILSHFLKCLKEKEILISDYLLKKYKKSSAGESIKLQVESPQLFSDKESIFSNQIEVIPNLSSLNHCPNFQLETRSSGQTISEGLVCTLKPDSQFDEAQLTARSNPERLSMKFGAFLSNSAIKNNFLKSANNHFPLSQELSLLQYAVAGRKSLPDIGVSNLHEWIRISTPPLHSRFQYLARLLEYPETITTPGGRYMLETLFFRQETDEDLLRKNLENASFIELCNRVIKTGLETFTPFFDEDKLDIQALAFFVRFYAALKEMAPNNAFTNPLPFIKNILNQGRLRTEQCGILQFYFLLALSVEPEKELSAATGVDALVAWIDYKTCGKVVDYQYLEEKVFSFIESVYFPDPHDAPSLYPHLLEKLHTLDILPCLTFDRIDQRGVITGRCIKGHEWIIDLKQGEIIGEYDFFVDRSSPFFRAELFIRESSLFNIDYPPSIHQIEETIFGFNESAFASWIIEVVDRKCRLKQIFNEVEYVYFPSYGLDLPLPPPLLNKTSFWFSSDSNGLIFNQAGKCVAKVHGDRLLDPSEMYDLYHTTIDKIPCLEKRREGHVEYEAYEHVLFQGEPLIFEERDSLLIYKRNPDYYLTQRENGLFPDDTVILDAVEPESPLSLVLIKWEEKYHEYQWNRSCDMLKATTAEDGCFLAAYYFRKGKYRSCIESLESLNFREKISVNARNHLLSIIQDTRLNLEVGCCAIRAHAFLEKNYLRDNPGHTDYSEIIGNVSLQKHLVRSQTQKIPFYLYHPTMDLEIVEEATFEINLPAKLSDENLNPEINYRALYCNNSAHLDGLEVKQCVFDHSLWEEYFAKALQMAIYGSEEEKENLHFWLRFVYLKNQYDIDSKPPAKLAFLLTILKNDLPLEPPPFHQLPFDPLCMTEEQRKEKRECQEWIATTLRQCAINTDNQEVSQTVLFDALSPSKKFTVDRQEIHHLLSIPHDMQESIYNVEYISHFNDFFSGLRSYIEVSREIGQSLTIDTKQVLEDFGVESIEAVTKDEFNNLIEEVNHFVCDDVDFKINNDNLKKIQEENNSRLTEIKNTQDELSENILQLANSIDKLGLEYRVMQDTDWIPTLQMHQLEEFFLAGQIDRLQAINPSLNKAACQEIFLKIAHYLTLKIILHKSKEIKKACQILSTSESEDERQDQLNKLFEYSSPLIDLENKYAPLLLVFQARTGLVLRPKQGQFFHQLMSDWSKALEDQRPLNGLLQYLMGGGKTSVFARLFLRWMRRERPSGDKILPMFFVPEAQYESVKSSLGHQMLDLFNLPIEEIAISRDQINVGTCNELLERIQLIQENGGFLLATTKDVLTLYLGYIESIYKVVIEDRDEDLALVKALSVLLNELRDHGLSLFDEVQILLDPMHEMFFPVGKPMPVSKVDIEFVRDVFLYLSANDDFGLSANTQNAISEQKIRVEVAQTLADQFFTDPRLNIPRNFHKDFVAYVKGDVENIESSFLDFLEERAESSILHLQQSVNLIAGLQALVQVIFPTTWSKQANRGYGFRPGGKGKICSYAGANSPLPFEFGWYMTALVYQFQAAMQLNIEVDQFQYLIEQHFIKQAKKQSQQGKIPYSKTEAASEFEQYTGYSLLEFMGGVNVDKLLPILEEINANTEIRIHLSALTASLIITDFPTLFKATTSSFLSLLCKKRGGYGMTGTPFNKKCYGPLEENFIPDFGVNSKIAHTLFRQAKEDESLVQTIYTSVPLNHLVDQLYLDEENVEMVLDAAGIFKNYSNDEVARELAEQKGKPVVFFTTSPQENVFLPDSVALLFPGQEKVIYLEGTDIQHFKMLNMELGEWIVFIDERHTTGTDIPVSSSAIGVVTVDPTVEQYTLFQTVMRLRKHGNNQKARLLLSQETEAAFHFRNEDSAVEKISKILYYLSLNEHKSLKPKFSHFMANQEQQYMQDEIILPILEKGDRVTKDFLTSIFNPDLFLLQRTGGLYEQCGRFLNQAAEQNNRFADTTVEIHTQTLADVTIPEDLLVDPQDRPKQIPKTPYSWSMDEVLNIMHDSRHDQCFSLNEEKEIFSEDFVMTLSCRHTSNVEDFPMTHPASRKIEYIFFYRGSDAQLNAIALSPSEGEDFSKVIESNDDLPDCWLVYTTVNATVATNRIEKRRPIEVERFLVQAHWYNGNIESALSYPEALIDWLCSDEYIDERKQYAYYAIQGHCPSEKRADQFRLLETHSIFTHPGSFLTMQEREEVAEVMIPEDLTIDFPLSTSEKIIKVCRPIILGLSLLAFSCIFTVVIGNFCHIPQFTLTGYAANIISVATPVVALVFCVSLIEFILNECRQKRNNVSVT